MVGKDEFGECPMFERVQPHCVDLNVCLSTVSRKYRLTDLKRQANAYRSAEYIHYTTPSIPWTAGSRWERDARTSENCSSPAFFPIMGESERAAGFGFAVRAKNCQCLGCARTFDDANEHRETAILQNRQTMKNTRRALATGDGDRQYLEWQLTLQVAKLSSHQIRILTRIAHALAPKVPASHPGGNGKDKVI